ncbi:MAG: MFS transporter [Ktedonobacteraceae bacterium]|nr:MFS transporter [Ktedonobacteraceae bacterium]
MTTNRQVVPSEWTPLHIAAFRAIWFASLAANVGTWLQNVGGVWLMTSFTASPLLIALMQTATTLPVFLVGFPAGALADIVNRRRLLLATQGLLLITAAVLSVLTFARLMNAPLLLGFTFVLGLGAILANPAWQAVNTELVPPEELPAAVTLTSVSYNLARAVGPAVAGLVIAAAGPAAVFFLNAIAFLYVVVVLSRWHPSPHRAVLPTERLVGAMRTGVRFVQNSPEMQTVLIRTFFFIFFISGLWALLPVIIIQDLRLGAPGYGLLLGCIGVGAVVGAAVLPQIQRKIPVVDQQVSISTVVLALVMIALGYVRILVVLCLIATIGGVAWIMLVSSFNVAAQEASPAWVRARALGAYLVVYQGGTAIGSVVWGAVAARLGDPLAILLAALGAVLGLAAGLRWHLADSEKQDLRPWHVSAPRLLIEPRLQEGPVMVQTEYCVDPPRAEDFLRAMREVRRMRERDGAFGWFLAHDPADVQRHVETFMAESWLDYLRQLDRMTNADHATLDHARSFHQGSAPPTVTSLIAEHPNWRGTSDSMG